MPSPIFTEKMVTSSSSDDNTKFFLIPTRSLSCSWFAWPWQPWWIRSTGWATSTWTGRAASSQLVVLQGKGQCWSPSRTPYNVEEAGSFQLQVLFCWSIIKSKILVEHWEKHAGLQGERKEINRIIRVFNRSCRFWTCWGTRSRAESSNCVWLQWPFRAPIQSL